jgi:MFS family permease
MPLAGQTDGNFVTTDIPARLDRLPWSQWHMMVVIALGITWLLDGLEGNLAGALSGILKRNDTLGFTDSQIGLASTIYLLGAVAGALGFGYATDRLGRKRLFVATLLVYLSATAATAFSWNFASFAFFRALTGAGIGGEYAAINSAVDELIPAPVRGHVDLLINSTFWIGAALGSGASLLLLRPGRFPIDMGWRLTFGIGAIIGLGILVMRRQVPESPRWLLIHGQKEEAEKIVAAIEKHVADHPEKLPQPDVTLRLQQRDHTPWREIRQAMAHTYRRRSILSFFLMVTQAFFYNAITFTYGLVLLRFYGAPAETLGLYLVPLAIANLCGPILMGRLFDTVGRKKMIAATYVVSGAMLCVASCFFLEGKLTAATQTIAWSVVFFVASTAASSAYLTVSEVFPLEIRAFAIAIFYACGTFVGGAFGPALYGYIVGTGSRTMLFWGYVAGGLVMVCGGLVEIWLGVDAERKSLESIAAPLSSQDFVHAK